MMQGSNPGSKKLLFQNIQTGLGTYPASYSMGTSTLSLGVKQPEQGANQSSPPGALVKNEWG